MSWLCPTCHSPLSADTLTCATGHQFYMVDGVLVLLDAAFQRELAAFTGRMAQARAAENKILLDAQAYPALPFGQIHQRDKAWQTEWRLRIYDLAIIERCLQGRPPQQILEVGAWNGWLSHQLVARGHTLTATDFFADEYDGLRAKKFYRPLTWQAIQMDVRDLTPLNQQFDLVILNRCLQFSPDPVRYATHAKTRVRPGGDLLLTGLQFFRQTAAKAHNVLRRQQLYRERYGAELFLFPNTGYLDFATRAQLQSQGIELHLYPQLRLANLLAEVIATRPQHAYGIWRKYADEEKPF